MSETIDYVSINRVNWDERAPLHAQSPDYNVQDFLVDPKFISKVVAFDQSLLGDISGLNCIHLQCHIGTDTLSLSRLGAMAVTGLDFSAESLKQARYLAEQTSGAGGERVKYVHATVYEALDVLPPESFDLVFTGIGALCWLHSIRDWAKVVAGLLKPGGKLFVREGHPMLWALDYEVQAGLQVEYAYFERATPQVFEDAGTYVDTACTVFKSTQTAEFNHGLGEIVQALLDSGMRLTGLREHDSVPWEAVPGQMTSLGNGESYSLSLSQQIVFDDGTNLRLKASID